MSMFVDWSVVLYFYGTCISYLILVGGTFDHLLHYYTEAHQHWYKCPSPPPPRAELGLLRLLGARLAALASSVL